MDSRRRASECQVRPLTKHPRLHTFNPIYWPTQSMRAFLIYISPLIFGVALLAIEGCNASPLYVQTSGAAGPLQWEAVDLASGVEIREGKEVDTYDFTLILRE